MKKLLLLDADVVIDLHTLELFDKICGAYDVKVTKQVFDEVKYYPKNGIKRPINISNEVQVINDIDVDFLKMIQREEREARLTIQLGEKTSIAYLLQAKEDITLCLVDKAAIKIVSYMDLNNKTVSLEKALRKAGHHTKLFPRHLETSFRKCIEEGKVLRLQNKLLP